MKKNPCLQLVPYMVVCMCLCACHKQSLPNLKIIDYKEICKETNNNDNFIFFTDPHISPSDMLFGSYIDTLYYYSNALSTICICGGDWLNSMDTQIEAEIKLKGINEITNSLLGPNYFPILGNHDTNYQGILNEKSERNTGRFSQDKIVELLFAKHSKAYYSFNSSKSKFIILDTGIDWESNIDEYRSAQINWFIDELLDNRKRHVIILLHIYTNNMIDVEPFANEIMRISELFNDKSCSSGCNFSNTQGTVACFICGHCHNDFIDYHNSIPVIGFTHFLDGGTPTFDLCSINWDTNTLNTVRVGKGENRKIALYANENHK